jgi:hypothetical protein
VVLPPFVVTVILPVAAPVGTVGVISESETTVYEADILSSVTLVVCVRPVPLKVMTVPTGPLEGVKLL